MDATADLTEALDALRAYLHNPTATDAELTPVLTSATHLVDKATSGRDVPGEILTLAVHKVAAELWAARDAVGGIVAGYSDLGGSVRLARDPMIAARPILAPWIGVAFG